MMYYVATLAKNVRTRHAQTRWYPSTTSAQPKPETLQPIGAFKLRGAYNKVASLSEDDRRRGVISYSSGNHGQGVAYAARALGVQAIIVMPGNAPKNKLEATAAVGADVITVGPGSEERRLRAEELAPSTATRSCRPTTTKRLSP